jgi:hypothetical protein
MVWSLYHSAGADLLVLRSPALGPQPYRIGLFRNDEAAPAALGRFVHVYVDAVSRRPVPVPESIRRALGRLVLP